MHASELVEGERYWYERAARTGRGKELVEVELRRSASSGQLGFYHVGGTYLNLRPSMILCHVDDLDAARQRQGVGADRLLADAREALEQADMGERLQQLAEQPVMPEPLAPCELVEGEAYVVSLHDGRTRRTMHWTGIDGMFREEDGTIRGGRDMRGAEIVCLVSDAPQLGLLAQPVLHRADRSLAWAIWQTEAEIEVERWRMQRDRLPV